jgi:thioredoxin reductase
MTATRGFDFKSQAGKVPAPDRHVEVLVVGGGAAGVEAATEAAKGGAKVLLVDEHPVSPGLMGLDTPLYFGGRYTSAVRSPARMMAQIFAARPALETAYEAGVEVELGVSCWGAWTPGYGLASLPSSLAGLADEDRAWMVGFDRLVLATGARDATFAFKGWDLPGVMGARGFEALLSLYDAFAGRRLAILGSGDLAIGCARLALARGLEVAALIEVNAALRGDPAALRALADQGVDVLSQVTPVVALGGRDGVEGLTVRDLRSGGTRDIACDSVVQAISLTPVVELLDVLGGKIAMQPNLGGHAPVSEDGAATSLPNVFLAGEAAGVPGGDPLSLEAAGQSGRRAARAVLLSLGRPTDVPATSPLVPGPNALTYQQTWMRALMVEDLSDVAICQCEEVSFAALLAVRPPAYLGPPPPAQAARDLAGLLEDGPPNQDQIKRLTRACMGPCQARRCREQVALALAGAANQSPEEIPLAGYRAPVRPLPLKTLADWNESAVMARHWDVWMGIRGQWAPYADVGTERETLNDDLLGGDLHL